MIWYAVVTSGSPNFRLKSHYGARDMAVRAANRAQGTGSCTTARVYECRNRRLAVMADIDECRKGERTVYSVGGMP